MKPTFKGFFSVLLHPSRLKRLAHREVRFRNRLLSKERWLTWQVYDSKQHIEQMESHPAIIAGFPLQIQRLKIILGMVSSVGRGLDILDVGCGNGTIYKPIADTGNLVTSVELRGISGLSRRCGVRCVISGDAESLGFVNEGFDIVVASEVAEHLWEPELFFKEAHRVLKNKGFLIVSTPDGEIGLEFDSHRHFFTEERLQGIASGGFAMCQLKRLGPEHGASPTLIVMLQKIKIDKDAAGKEMIRT